MLQLICDQRLDLILILVQLARTAMHDCAGPWRLVLFCATVPHCHMMWLAQLYSAIFDTSYLSLRWLYSFFIIFMNVIIKTFNWTLFVDRGKLSRLFTYSISLPLYRNAIIFGSDNYFVRYRCCLRLFHILFYDETIFNHNTNEFGFVFATL